MQFVIETKNGLNQEYSLTISLLIVGNSFFSVLAKIYVMNL